jgi:serine O-acetyltransferase
MLSDLRADLQRYTGLIEDGPQSGLHAWRGLVETQGVWAISVYRFGRWANEEAPPSLRLAAKAAYLGAFKLAEILTGVSLPARARIGKGFYIGHFGNIIVHPDTIMGERCSLSQGVTIGVLGGDRLGVPRLGNDVYVGAGAKILGPVTIGDGAIIGANAVVLEDVPAGATAVGVPARVIPARAKEARRDGEVAY